MKEFIIDANVLFSAIISQKPIYIDLVNNYKIYAPDFILREIDKYNKFLLSKIDIENRESPDFIRDLFDEITIIPSFAVPQSYKDKAFELCKDIDEKDTPYLALSMQLNIILLTGDKGLALKLPEKGYKDVMLVREIFDKLYQEKKEEEKES